jgi:hypothetical protein
MIVNNISEFMSIKLLSLSLPEGAVHHKYYFYVIFLDLLLSSDILFLKMKNYESDYIINSGFAQIFL